MASKYIRLKGILPGYDRLFRNLAQHDLFRSSARSIGIRVVFAALNLALLAILARAMQPEEFGQFAILIATVSLLVLPLQAGVGNLIVREVAGGLILGERELLVGLMKRVLPITVCCSGTVAAVALAIIYAYQPRGVSLSIPVFASALMVPLLTVIAVQDAAIRAIGWPILGQVSQMLFRPLLSVALVTLLVFHNNQVTLAQGIGCVFVSTIAAFILSTVLYKRIWSEAVGQAPAKYQDAYWLKSVLPLVLFVGFRVINQQAGTLLVGLYAGPASAGMYRVISQATEIISLIDQALAAVVGPRLSRQSAQQDQLGLSRTLRWASSISVYCAAPLFIIYLLFGSELLRIGFGAKFAAGHIPLVVLSFGQVVFVAIGPLTLLLNMIGREAWTSAGYASSALLNILLAVQMVPRFGVMGMVTSALLAQMVLCVILIYGARTELGLPQSHNQS